MRLSSAAPMYTVPKFIPYSLHQTEIHFRSPTYVNTLTFKTPSMKDICQTVIVLGIFRVISSLLKEGSKYLSVLALALSSYSYTSPVLGTRILVVKTSAIVSGEPSVPIQKNASGPGKILIINRTLGFLGKGSLKIKKISGNFAT